MCAGLHITLTLLAAVRKEALAMTVFALCLLF